MCFGRWFFVVWFMSASLIGSTQWTIYNSSNSSLPNNTVRTVQVDTFRNGVWSGTDFGLAFYDGTNWTTYTTANSNIPGNLIECVSIDPNNRVWVGTRTNGIGVFDGINWVAINSANSGLPDNEVNDVDFSAAGNIWVATGNGLAKYDSTTWQVWDVNNSPLWSNHILTIDHNAQDHTYAGLLNGGVVVMNDTGMVILHGSVQGFPDNTVRTIQLDNGLAWCSTPSKGVISIFPDYSWGVYADDNSLLPTNATNSLQRHSGYTYIATMNEGLVRLMGTQYIAYNSGNSPIPENNILSIDIDPNGIIWLGTGQSGLVRFDELLSVPGFTPHAEVFTIYPNPVTRATSTVSTDKTTTGKVQLYALDGRLLHQLYAKRGTIALPQLASGVYLLQADDGSFGKLMVE